MASLEEDAECETGCLDLSSIISTVQSSRSTSSDASVWREHRGEGARQDVVEGLGRCGGAGLAAHTAPVMVPAHLCRTMCYMMKGGGRQPRQRPVKLGAKQKGVGGGVAPSPSLLARTETKESMPDDDDGKASLAGSTNHASTTSTSNANRRTGRDAAEDGGGGVGGGSDDRDNDSGNSRRRAGVGGGGTHDGRDDGDGAAFGGGGSVDAGVGDGRAANGVNGVRQASPVLKPIGPVRKKVDVDLSELEGGEDGNAEDGGGDGGDGGGGGGSSDDDESDDDTPILQQLVERKKKAVQPPALRKTKSDGSVVSTYSAGPSQAPSVARGLSLSGLNGQGLQPGEGFVIPKKTKKKSKMPVREKLSKDGGEGDRSSEDQSMVRHGKPPRPRPSVAGGSGTEGANVRGKGKRKRDANAEDAKGREEGGGGADGRGGTVGGPLKPKQRDHTARALGPAPTHKRAAAAQSQSSVHAHTRPAAQAHSSPQTHAQASPHAHAHPDGSPSSHGDTPPRREAAVRHHSGAGDHNAPHARERPSPRGPPPSQQQQLSPSMVPHLSPSLSDSGPIQTPRANGPLMPADREVEIRVISSEGQETFVRVTLHCVKECGQKESPVARPKLPDRMAAFTLPPWDADQSHKWLPVEPNMRVALQTDAVHVWAVVRKGAADDPSVWKTDLYKRIGSPKARGRPVWLREAGWSGDANKSDPQILYLPRAQQPVGAEDAAFRTVWSMLLNAERDAGRAQALRAFGDMPPQEFVGLLCVVSRVVRRKPNPSPGSQAIAPPAAGGHRAQPPLGAANEDDMDITIDDSTVYNRPSPSSQPTLTHIPGNPLLPPAPRPPEPAAPRPPADPSSQPHTHTPQQPAPGPSVVSVVPSQAYPYPAHVPPQAYGAANVPQPHVAAYQFPPPGYPQHMYPQVPAVGAEQLYQDWVVQQQSQQQQQQPPQQAPPPPQHLQRQPSSGPVDPRLKLLGRQQPQKQQHPQQPPPSAAQAAAASGAPSTSFAPLPSPSINAAAASLVSTAAHATAHAVQQVPIVQPSPQAPIARVGTLGSVILADAVAKLGDEPEQGRAALPSSLREKAARQRQLQQQQQQHAEQQEQRAKAQADDAMDVDDLETLLDRAAAPADAAVVPPLAVPPPPFPQVAPLTLRTSQLQRRTAPTLPHHSTQALHVLPAFMTLGGFYSPERVEDDVEGALVSDGDRDVTVNREGFDQDLFDSPDDEVVDLLQTRVRVEFTVDEMRRLIGRARDDLAGARREPGPLTVRARCAFPRVAAAAGDGGRSGRNMGGGRDGGTGGDVERDGGRRTDAEGRKWAEVDVRIAAPDTDARRKRPRDRSVSNSDDGGRRGRHGGDGGERLHGRSSSGSLGSGGRASHDRPHDGSPSKSPCRRWTLRRDERPVGGREKDRDRAVDRSVSASHESDRRLSRDRSRDRNRSDTDRARGGGGGGSSGGVGGEKRYGRASGKEFAKPMIKDPHEKTDTWDDGSDDGQPATRRDSARVSASTRGDSRSASRTGSRGRGGGGGGDGISPQKSRDSTIKRRKADRSRSNSPKTRKRRRARERSRSRSRSAARSRERRRDRDRRKADDGGVGSLASKRAEGGGTVEGGRVKGDGDTERRGQREGERDRDGGNGGRPKVDVVKAGKEVQQAGGGKKGVDGGGGVDGSLRAAPTAAAAAVPPPPPPPAPAAPAASKSGPAAGATAAIIQTFRAAARRTSTTAAQSGLISTTAPTATTDNARGVAGVTGAAAATASVAVDDELGGGDRGGGITRDMAPPPARTSMAGTAHERKISEDLSVAQNTIISSLTSVSVSPTGTMTSSASSSSSSRSSSSSSSSSETSSDSESDNEAEGGEEQAVNARDTPGDAALRGPTAAPTAATHIGGGNESLDDASTDMSDGDDTPCSSFDDDDNNAIRLEEEDTREEEEYLQQYTAQRQPMFAEGGEFMEMIAALRRAVRGGVGEGVRSCE